MTLAKVRAGDLRSGCREIVVYLCTVLYLGNRYYQVLVLLMGRSPSHENMIREEGYINAKQILYS